MPRDRNRPRRRGPAKTWDEARLRWNAENSCENHKYLSGRAQATRTIEPYDKLAATLYFRGFCNPSMRPCVPKSIAPFPCTRSVLLLNHLSDALERPVDFVARDGERRSDTQNLVVSLLAQNALVFERLAVGSRGAVQFDSDPQSPAANFFQIWTAERLQ